MTNGYHGEAVSSIQRVKSELNEVIKQEVEETFGHRIVTSRDCIQLSEEIYFKTSFRINPNTLRRFFGLVKAQYPPSISTLSILAGYCGYNSLDELSAVRKKSPATDVDSDKQSFLKYIITLFTATPVREANDETFYFLVKHTIHFLSQHTDLATKFQRAIVKCRNGQEFYFEQFINIDKLNSFYGEGLRYYISERNTAEGQIFGYSLLCLRDWLSMDHTALKKNFDFMKRQGLPRQTKPYVYGRYYAAHLLYADAFGLDTHKLLLEAYKVHADMKRNTKNLFLSQSMEYAMAGALLLTRRYEEALYYINEALLSYPETHTFMDQGCYRRLSILKAIAFYHTGRESEAERMYEQLRPSKFYFLSKKMDTILFLVLGARLKKINNKLEQQFMNLIGETGFIKLQAFLYNSVEHPPFAELSEQK